MSDSDSDSECGPGREPRNQRTNGTNITFHLSDRIFERWSNIPLETKIEAGQRMKVCAFWLPILLQREEGSAPACWAIEVGLISSKDSDDLSLKHLRNIDIVEMIFRALERGIMKKDQSRHVMKISNMFNSRSPEVFDDALHWLERTGEPNIRRRLMELGHQQTCFTALHLIFTEYATFIQEMGGSFDRSMKTLMARPDDYHIEKCEEMKKKGNENFQKQQYEDAVKFYSKAIKYYPDNHIIYGNRALCYIRCQKYLKAIGDGKRAMLIKPFWTKGHYRYCEALFSLGEVKMAVEANISAQSLCKDNPEGLKELEQQHMKFIFEMQAAKISLPTAAGSTVIKNPGQSFRAGLVMSRPPPVKPVHKTQPARSTTPKVSEVKVDKQPGKNEKTVQAEATKDSKPSKSEVPSKNVKAEPSTTVKKKSKNRNGQTENETAKVDDCKAGVSVEFKSLVQDAHTALTDLRSRNAEQTFSQALARLEAVTPKELGLSTVDKLLLLFGRASALTDIGQPEELSEAQKLLEKIKSYEERTFECLVFYAIGRVYLRENRFSDALEQFSDSLQMVKNQITPGKLTWPFTKEIVKETQPDYFKETLESSIELCRFPPLPDAICRLEKCLGSLKAEIYLTDPDFKGFIQICCCHNCAVEYHITCWKALKSSTFSEKNEKDFLHDACLTPDCVGQICSIKIYGPTGLVKCKFEAAIPKPETSKKPKVNQKCTSLKKLKSKEERKLKRKQHKSSQVTSQKAQVINNDETQQPKKDSAAHSQQKVWLVYRDRVLLQISQNIELLKEEKSLQVSDMTDSLKPWLELDSTKGNQIAVRMLNWEQEPLETLGQAVELLLERKNRVWARVFVQQLSSCVEINPKLNHWACQLNDAGLNAAKGFMERYAAHLEQLDLAVLLNFAPLQEMVIENLGTRPELFSSIGLTVTEYLKQAPPHHMRLFIWTLEEHREDYVSCHTILDEYFDMMDGHCSVLKKSDENENKSPMRTKSRGRKKKQKEPKGVFVWSERRGLTQRDEWDQDYIEDDSLSFLEPNELFSVPSHLREQVADFEEQYNSTRHRSHYKKILDNNPDPTKESLYDYFAQILDEHGPLGAEDPLLVGELVNFPHDAKLKIEEAGGFETFLLESLRFIKMGPCIGLAKHAVSLQQAGHGTILDDLDDLDELDAIVDPDNNSLSPDLYRDSETGLASYLNSYPSSQTEVYPILPNPYVSGFPSAGYDFLYQTNSAGQQASYFLPNGYMDVDLNEADGVVLETGSTSRGFALMTTDENVLKRHAAVQTCQEAMRSVAVNTELLEHFEHFPGDINKKEKNNKKLEEQIEKMSNSFNNVDPSSREDVILLEDEIQKINANISVTNKELALFQQKLEEEVKKDQKEKKANQEELKSLKQKIEELVEEQGGLARNIREKKTSYDAKLRDFLELSNQSAAEKMSLEDEIKRCKSLLTSATRRSHTAQLSAAESSRDQALYGLYRELADNKALLTKLDEAAHRFPNQELDLTRNRVRASVEETEKKISTVERQHKEQIDQVKNGGRVSELLQANNQPEPAAAPVRPQLSAAAKEFAPQAAAPPPVQQAAPHKPPTRTMEPPHNTVFDKAMESLGTMFPDYSRSELMKFVQELRSSSGGSLNNMALHDMVGGVTQLILDHQERLSFARSNIVNRQSPAQCATPPLVNAAPVWQPVIPQRVTKTNALNVEDPCIICHEDMSPEDTCVLDCRHSFHDECIRSWLKEQKTCPTCRKLALLPEDFPVLPGRRRVAP